MSPEDMRRAATEQIEFFGSDGKLAVTLRGRWGRRDTRRLWPGGPVGHIVSEIEGGRIVVLVSAREILAALDAGEGGGT